VIEINSINVDLTALQLPASLNISPVASDRNLSTIFQKSVLDSSDEVGKITAETVVLQTKDNKQVLVNIRKLAKFLEISENSIEKMMTESSPGKQKLGKMIVDVHNLRESLPKLFTQEHKNLIVAKAQASYDKIMEKSLHLSIPADEVKHIQKATLGLPVSLEKSGNKTYSLMKEAAFLDKGAFKKVALAVEKDDFKTFAHATIALDPTNPQTTIEKQRLDVLNEFRMQKQLEGPEFLKFFHIVEYKSTKVEAETGKITNIQKISIMMEYCNFGSLADLINSPPYPLIWNDANKWNVVEDCLKGLVELEAKGIHHRDLKLENILLTEHDGVIRAKIADFGYAVKVEEEKDKPELKGTPDYFSPRSVKGFFKIAKGNSEEIAEGKQMLADTKNDIWAMGLILMTIRTPLSPVDIILEQEPDANFTPQDLFRALLKLSQEDVDSTLDVYADADFPYLGQLNKLMLSIDAKECPPAERCFEIFSIMKAKDIPFR